MRSRLRGIAGARRNSRRKGVRSSATTTLAHGTKVGEVYEGQKIFDVVVRDVERVRSDVAALCEIPIETPQGVRIPLSQVAEVTIEDTPNQIKRDGGSRRIDVTCNAEGRDLDSVARDIEQEVRSLSFERGHHPEFALKVFRRLDPNRGNEKARIRNLRLPIITMVFDEPSEFDVASYPLQPYH